MRKTQGGTVRRLLCAPIAYALILLAASGWFATPAHGETYVVNTLNGICHQYLYDCGDDVDAQPGDGVAERILGGGQTTLRAAIMEANALEGHDIIMLPDDTFFLRVDLPPLTDPAGVTIMSMSENNFVLDGSTVSERLFAYRDLISANFAELDQDDDEQLTFAEAATIIDSDYLDEVRAITHNLGGLRSVDFQYLDDNGDNFIEQEELDRFRGAGRGFTIESPNNNIIGVTLVNFGDHGIVIEGADAHTNTIQGCNIGVLGTGAQDRAVARVLLENFADADGNDDEELTLNEARTVAPELGAGAFGRLDTDANDRISEAELTAIAALLDSEIAQLLIDDFSDADNDDSGALSLEEAQGVVEELVTEGFDRLDGDENGQLSQGELFTAIDSGDTVGVEGNANGNRRHGLVIRGGAHDNLIGGPGEGEGNIISGNGTDEIEEILVGGEPSGAYRSLGFGHGILIEGADTDNNVIQGNLIGLDETGKNPARNAFSGIVIQGNASNNLIGGVEAGTGNLIAYNGSPNDGCPDACGNAQSDVFGRGVIVRGGSTVDNVIQGNEIFNNHNTGIYYQSVVGGQIGGTEDGAGNTLYGHYDNNFSGSNIDLVGATNIRVEGNTSIGSEDGLVIFGGSNLYIGSPGAGNVFSDNTVGAYVFFATDVFIEGNFIGTDETGTVSRSNSYSGIYLAGELDNVRVGGPGEGQGNLISGNENDGIVIFDMLPTAGTDPQLYIQGNYIGTDITGSDALQNKVIGILVGPDANRVLIGGTAEGEGNVISGNGVDGIRVGRRPSELGTPDNIQILGNRIGVAALSSAAVPNGLNGVALLQVDEEVQLGGFGDGEGNVIARNTENGVRIKGGNLMDISSHTTVRGNTIYGNGLKGIALEEDGNASIPKPVMIGVDPIVGTAPAGSTVDIFSDSADEGEFFIGTATADGAGNFTLAVAIDALQANNVTATATDLATGDTSEFSDPLTLEPPVIDAQPASVTVVEGEPFSLAIEASGSQPITFQWEYLAPGASEFVDVTDDGTFSGAQTTTLDNAGARLADAGSYRCVATNILGDTPSATVTVNVIDGSTDVSTVSTLQDVVDGNTLSPAHLLADPGADGAISLREAITAANNRAGADTINFGVTGTILLTGGLPNLADDATTINGGGQITLDGNSLAGSIAGIRIVSADNVVRGLTLVRFPGSGVEIDGATATGNLVADCFIGTNGELPLGNKNHGVLIQNGAANNVIGGADAGDRNIISGNLRSGVYLTGTGTAGNQVLGNYIGLDSAGAAAIANGVTGVSILAGAGANEVGGIEEGEGNVISANTTTGVLVSGAGTSGNLIAANIIGLDATGAESLGNVQNGVAILDGATDTTVGGADPLAANTISGNGNAGVLIDGAATLRNTVRLNSIHANFNAGIALAAGANANVAAPEITMLGSVIGTATPGSTVDIYASEDDQGRLYLDSVVADGAGAFFSEVDLAIAVGLSITATATDVDGNTSAFSEAVFVDLAPPVLTLNGDAEVTAECGAPYTDAGVTAVDDVDGDLSGDVVVTITRNGGVVPSVDTSVLGVYTLLYEVSDSGGQVATPVSRTVTVVDTAAPEITLNGEASVTVECSTGFTDPGATATDTCEGDVAVSVAGVVDVSTPGQYALVYTATDAQGNAATPVTRTVTVLDTVAPVITLNGAASVTIECGAPYLDPGATATDACDTALEVVVDNPVEPGVAGVYTVLYDAVDASGNRAIQAFRTVEVVDTQAPVIQLLGAADLTVECGVPFVDPGVVVNDACEGGLPAIVTGGVNTDVPGNYTVVYSASDGAGNAADSVTRIVRVADNAAPEIQLNGPATVNVPCGGAYEELGATAVDACEGNLTEEIVIGGSVNTGVAGRYTITYDVQDSRGNVAARRTRTVIVATCPAPCEDQCATDPDNQVDEDGDGLSACVEACLGTDDTLIDSDNDGVPDNVEVETGTDPIIPDSDLDLDGDGLTQLEEFIFDSDSLDPNSPAVSFFVSPNGANAEAGGDAGSPWATIAYAIEQANPSLSNPVRIVLADGNYAENVELVPGVTLVGAVGSLPRIEGSVFGANDSALINVELAAFTSDDVLLVLDNVAMIVENVVFRGSAARPAAGILAIGAGARGSMIDGCLFTSLSIGIDVEGGLPAIRRCTFENTSIAGIFLRASAAIASGDSLGDADDPSSGSNLFSGVTEGRAVINDTNTLLLAQQNDWGTADVDFIEQNLVRGLVDVAPVLEPGTAVNTGALYVTVWTAATQSRISNANVVVTSAGGASVTIPLSRNGVYAVPVLRSGSYTLAVSAPLYETQEQAISLAPGELGSRIVALEASSVKPGGPSCSAAGGSLGALGWADALLAALLLALLVWMPARRSARA